MFGFLKKFRKINNNNVKNFDNAIRVIKTYIQMYDFWKALKWINEISQKEKESYNKLIETLWLEDSDKNKKLIVKESKKYEAKQKQLEKLKKFFDKENTKYIRKKKDKLFEIRFKKIKNEVNKLVAKKEPVEALNLIKNFQQENVESQRVRDFYEEQKKKIQNVIDRQRKQEQDKIKNNTQYEAMTLIWDLNKNKIDKEQKDKSFFKIIKDKFKKDKELRENIASKRALDEINMFLDENDKIKQELARQRLESIHEWLVKEINKRHLIGYDLYWKILWANKISWDSFWMNETKDKYKFFIWDATGHWIKAWLILTLLNKIFNIDYTKNIEDFVFDTNNQLKQELESRNFVTSIFFEIDKEKNTLSYVGMGHEPMLLYKSKTKTVEKIIPGGIAMWITKMADKKLVKVKNIQMDENDILITYSDWLVEAKNFDWKLYWVDKLMENFKFVCSNEKDIQKIYDYLIKDVKLYRWWSKFDDDLTIILLKRDIENDIVQKWDKYLEKMKVKEWLNTSDLKNIKWKTRREVIDEMLRIKKKKETKLIVSNLENLYHTWEMLKLKEEATRYIKDWYIDKKINYYLKKAIENESKYKINLKDQKMQAKYNVLEELYKKGEYDTVIKEIQDIISRDWAI